MSSAAKYEDRINPIINLYQTKFNELSQITTPGAQ